jgi:hypothetical protein
MSPASGTFTATVAVCFHWASLVIDVSAFCDLCNLLSIDLLGFRVQELRNVYL